MTDVRLTATNPEDSSVVPVACNAKGELLLEDAPAFDGNFDGDLTVSGTASIAGNATFGDYSTNGTTIFSSGSVAVNRSGSGSTCFYALLNGDEMAAITAGGAANFAGDVVVGGNYAVNESFVAIRGPGQIEIGRNTTSINVFIKGTWYYNGTINETFQVRTDGSATFAGDVVVGSRSKQWMLVEQSGLCHMVEQTTASTADLIDPDPNKYPPLRDVFAELNLIETALGEVMEKLRMKPPAGWEVWDGSDEIS